MIGLVCVYIGVSNLSSRWAVAQDRVQETHWAYRSIEKPPVPELPDGVAASGSITPIDHYVIRALSAANMTMSPAAGKWSLIRRATFDLTGLPPTWDQVQAFINDASPDAFAHVVDRLLSSPRYGEHWGRHWLDIARYADTHGGGSLVASRFPYSYTYRDYVIKSFDRDLPYDRFLLEQIAADQLPAVNPDSLAALGFLTVGRQFGNPHDVIDDRIDVVSRGLMGLTVACARCHDHKYDDIPTADYYSFYAVFAASEAPNDLPIVGKPEDSPPYREYQQELARRKRVRDDFVRDQSEIMRQRLRQQVGMYLTELVKGTPEQDLSTIYLSYRTDDMRPPVLERWRKYLATEVSAEDPVFGVWHQLSKLPAQEFAEESKKTVQQMRDANGEVGASPEKYHQLDSPLPHWNPRVLDAMTARPLASMLDVAAAYGELFATVQAEWLRGLNAAALEASSSSADVSDVGPEHADLNSPVNRQLRYHLYAPTSPTAVSDQLAIELLNRPLRDHAGGLQGAVGELHLNHPGSPPRAMALVERESIPAQHVFESGMPLDRGEAVPPRFLSVLAGSHPKTFSNGRRRLELAEAIVDPSNPLTRRVAVNWVWQHHFENGIVRTPDNFGVEGERPTHPELLDYLAARLLESGWSIKQLHREIMLSATYQQAAIENSDYRLRDPENRLLWRMPSRRLGLEAMRDAMLAVAGRLDTTMGGRPFDLFAEPFVPRRTIYGFINRDVVPAMFSTFDMADPNSCTAARPLTTVPQQALFALNSNFIFEQSSHLSKLQDIGAAANNSERISALYRHIYARQPHDGELAACVAYLESQSDEPAESWSRLAQALLAANEFVFVD